MTQPNRNDLDLKKVVYILSKKWVYFLISVLVMFTLFIITINLLKQSFIVSSTILLKDKNNSVVSNENFDESLNLFRAKRNLENEISILKSHETLLETVKKLKINVQYFKKYVFSKTELYGEAPFKIVYDSNHIEPANFYINVKFKNQDEFELSSSSKECFAKLLLNDSLSEKITFQLNHKGKMGEVIQNSYCSFYLIPSEDHIIEPGKTYGFLFQSNNDLALLYQEKIKIEQQGIESSIIKVYLESEVPEKDRDVVNMLCNTYIQLGIDDKNSLAKNSIRYINEQLESIDDSISNLNKKILLFHSGNRIVDIDLQTKYNYEKLSQLESERAALLAENKYCRYLFDYINSNVEKNTNINILAPSTSGVNDPLLERVLNELTKLNQERSSLLFSANASNPSLQMIDLKVKEAKKTLIENVKSILETSKIRLDENMANMLPVIKNLSNMPMAEQHLVNVKRDYNHYDVLHDYLMKKRTEATIALASSTPHHSILDKPKISKLPTKPNKKILLMLFGFLSLAVPGAYFIIRDLLNPILYTRQDILKSTSLRLIGSVPKVSLKETSVGNISETSFLESMARLVQNLKSVTESTSPTVIGVGSLSESEGKTFCALSLATAFAEIQTKVVIIDFNLRNPRIGDYSGIKNSRTLNEYFENKISIEQLIMRNVASGFDMAISTLCVNPRKILKQNQLEIFFSALKNSYSVIILDTSAIKSYSDFDLLKKIIDINLFVVTKNVTEMRHLWILEEFASNSDSKSYIVFNKDENF